MKKIIGILRITLPLIVLVSCSNDDAKNKYSTSQPEVTTRSISGSYKITVAIVDQPVDTNNDGVFTQNLLQDDYNSCEFNSRIEISPSAYSIIKKGTNCTLNEKNEIYEYKLNETTKTLELYEYGKVIETFNDLSLYTPSGSKKLYYQKFDSFLNQKILFELTRIY